MSGSQSQISPQQQNAINRNIVLGNSLEMMQSIASGSIASPSSTIATVLNIPPRNAGLIKSFLVQVSVNFTTGSGTTGTRNPFGPANILSQVVFSDLNNMQRVNTTGWHLSMLNTVKRKRAVGSAFTTDSPLGFGSNFGSVISAPATLAASTNYTMNMIYEIPIAYSDQDLRGAIYAALTNSTMNLQLTFNPTMFQTSGNKLLNCYTYSGGTLTVNNYTYNVYQNYLDQIPFGSDGRPIVPMIDLSFYNDLKNTNYSGLVVGQEFPMPYANLRQFLSTIVVYDNNSVLNAGTDVNYFSLKSANTTAIFQMDPSMIAYRTRNLLNDDMPVGSYLFDTRGHPINTQTYGNMSLYMNPSSVGSASASLFVGYEAIGQSVVTAGAGSLGGG